MTIDHSALMGLNKQQKSIQFAFGEVFQQFVIKKPATQATKARFYQEISRAIRTKNLPVELLGINRVQWITAGTGPRASVLGLSVPVKINGLEQVVMLRTDLGAQRLKKAITPTASAPV